MKNKLIGLNEEQIEFVLCKDKHILLIAAAGSGKTLVVTRKVGWLLENRVPAEKIFCISFTRAAAKELKDRISYVDKQGKNVYTGTFHSFIIDIMKKYCNQDCNMISESERNTILDEICKTFKIKSPKTLLNAFKQSIKNADKSLQYGINEYILKLKLLNLMDIDILLPLFLDLLEKDESLLEKIRDDINYIFYDEAQDINKVQNDILTKIIPPSCDKGLILIGDEDQNLYEWNNTDIEYILGFEARYKAKRFILDKNYRCSNQIIDISNSLIKNNTKRFNKSIQGFFDSKPIVIENFKTEQEEILRILGVAIQYIEKPNKTLAILCRSNSEIKRISKIFKEFNVEFNTSIKEEFNRNIIDYIKVIVNPFNDLLFSKFMNINKDDKISALENRCSLYEILLARKDEQALLIQQLNLASKSITALSMLNLLNKKTSIVIDKSIVNAIYLWSNNISKNDINNIQNFINYLESKEAQENLREGSSNINIITIHSSKGLEFNEVILFNFNAINYNTIGNVEETRRLLYVAITRAKENLNFYYSNKFLIRYKEESTEISPFINELNIK